MPTARLVVLFDGTDNTPKDRTNVWRTHELIADSDSAGIPQQKRYIQGVGTEIGELVRGSIFGTGIARKITEGYKWLVENYKEGSEIYVFGFSRGAFAARSLVQMIATCGLTQSTALSKWTPEATFDRYEAISRQESELVHPIWRLRFWAANPGQASTGWAADAVESRLLDELSVRVVKIRMAGLWDTVGAIGTDALSNRGASTQKSAAHNVRPTKAQEFGYHALAIDEHRPMFEATLWRKFLPDGVLEAEMQNLSRFYEQRWFIGAHSDVGGGYGDDDLPDLSLHWMMEKASNLGLAFTHKIEPKPMSWMDPVHDSFKAFAGKVLSIWDELVDGDQRAYREIGRAPRPVVTANGISGNLWSINETLDESVLRRLAEDPCYRPPGLVDYLERNPQLIPPGASTAQRTERIYANQYWNRTGIYLRPNVTYEVRVVPGTGEPLRDAEFLSRGIEGEEWNSIAHRTSSQIHGKRNDDAKWFALIATVDKKHPKVVKDGMQFKVPVGGQLLCYFNDVQIEWFYENNSGWVVLEIREV